jgi:hypothetical protein
MQKDFDATDYLGSDYVRKQGLRADGPRRVIIRDIQQSDRLKDKDGTPLLVLVFDNGLRYTLGTKVNIKRLVEVFGKMCSAWIGCEIELYYAEDVVGPNGETGGIRIRIPKAAVGARRPTHATPAPTAPDLEMELAIEDKGDVGF